MFPKSFRGQRKGKNKVWPPHHMCSRTVKAQVCAREEGPGFEGCCSDGVG